MATKNIFLMCNLTCNHGIPGIRNYGINVIKQRKYYLVRYKSTIYTKGGDKGTSALFNGERRPKYDPVFEGLGNIDELSCNIGMAREYLLESWQKENFVEMNTQLENIQCALQDIGSNVATPKSSSSLKHIEKTSFDENLILELENLIDDYTKHLPELKNFILPSGGKGSCSLHISRSICRRAERSLSSLVIEKDVDDNAYKYLNRLSDFLFTAARYVATMEGQPEVIYRKPQAKQKEIIDEIVNDNVDNK